MFGYIVKRLLLIPPKFFVISLIVFGLLNLASGPPPDPGGGAEGKSATGQGTNLNYVMFKRQFNLDKPILVNLRFWTSPETVRAWVIASADVNGDATIPERADAQTVLDDYGNDLVVHLIPLLKDPNPTLRRAAASRLAAAAPLQPLADDAGPVEEVKATNAARAAEADTMRGWTWAKDADAGTEAAQIERWNTWWAGAHAAYEYDTTRMLTTVLGETRFARYWANLIRLRLGESTMTHRPVLEMIQERVPYSLALSLVSITLAYLIALPIGIYSASRPGTLADSVTTLFLFLLYSLPSFFTGTVLLLLLSTGEHRIFPSGGFFSPDLSGATALGTLRDAGWHLVLPVATYTSGVLASLSRYARSGIVDVIRADYVRTARAKGLSEVVVVVKHAARNGMIPILTLLGGLLPALVGGSVIIESVFNIPGMGLYLYQSISNYDYNAVMGVLLISSLLTLFGIFLSDLSYALVDPRISYE